MERATGIEPAWPAWKATGVRRPAKSGDIYDQAVVAFRLRRAASLGRNLGRKPLLSEICGCQ
jgi:hypothetical protein